MATPWIGASVSLLGPLLGAIVLLALVAAFLWASRSGVRPLALLGGVFLAGGTILAIHALTEASGPSNAEAQTSALLAVGFLVSGALMTGGRRAEG